MVLCRFAVGRIVPLELVNSVAGGDVHSVVPPLRQREGEVFAVGVKLRQVGPIAFASAAYCIVEPRRSRGEKRLQLQVVVTRPWCGPRGYIQVGMRG